MKLKFKVEHVRTTDHGSFVILKPVGAVIGQIQFSGVDEGNFNLGEIFDVEFSRLGEVN